MPRPLPSPVVLLLIALPAATLAAGVATLAVIGRGGLDAVGDPVRRTAQVQQVDLRADGAARRLGLSGRLTVDGDAAWLDLVGLPVGADAGTLLLQLEHPLDADADTVQALRWTDGRWRSPAFDRSVGWRVAVAPEDGGWRLVARWPRGGGSTSLEPAVDGPADSAAR